MVNEGGIAHSFTEVKTLFGGGIVPPFNVAVNNAPKAVTVNGTLIVTTPGNSATIVPTGSGRPRCDSSQGRGPAPSLH